MEMEIESEEVVEKRYLQQNLSILFFWHTPIIIIPAKSEGNLFI